MSPSFNDLSYFFEAANLLNFSQAAQKLHVSQPTLSLAINRLESLLDTSLFIRHHQGVTLTQSGERLYQHVSLLLDQWRKTQASIQSLHSEVSGKITIGCHPVLAPQLGSITSALLSSHPLLDIQLRHEQSDKMTELVITGALDIALVYDPLKHPDLVMIKVDEFEMTFWESIEVATNYNIVICNPEVRSMHTLAKAYEQQHEVTRVCSVNNYEMTAHLVANGAGIGILPACIVDKFYKNLLQQMKTAPSLPVELFLIYRGENRNMQARNVVLNAIKDYINATANPSPYGRGLAMNAGGVSVFAN